MRIQRWRPIKVRLRRSQREALMRMARRENVSISELGRRAVDLLLTEVPVENDPAMRLIGLGRSRKGDLSEAHDRYVVKALRRRKH